MTGVRQRTCTSSHARQSSLPWPMQSKTRPSQSYVFSFFIYWSTLGVISQLKPCDLSILCPFITKYHMKCPLTSRAIWTGEWKGRRRVKALYNPSKTLKHAKATSSNASLYLFSYHSSEIPLKTLVLNNTMVSVRRASCGLCLSRNSDRASRLSAFVLLS